MLFNDEASELIFIAENDFKSAQILANHYQPQIEISCYHCQQCAEKALKAFISFHKNSFKFIHNLNELRTDCQIIDQSFITITEECEVLNRYFNDTRYSSKLDLTETHLHQALKHAEKILNFVKEKTANPSTEEAK